MPQSRRRLHYRHVDQLVLDQRQVEVRLQAAAQAIDLRLQLGELVGLKVISTMTNQRRN